MDMVYERDADHDYVACAEALAHLMGNQPRHPDARRLTVVVGGNPGAREGTYSPYVDRAQHAAVTALGPTRVHYINIGAWVEVDSALLTPGLFDAGRMRNRTVVLEKLDVADHIIAAWGNPPLEWGREDLTWIRRRLNGRDNVWRHPELTSQGQPRHAQTWRVPQPLVRWSFPNTSSAAID